MTAAGSVVRCSGCGYTADASDPYPFRCPRAGRDGGDHVMTRVLDIPAAGSRGGRAPGGGFPSGGPGSGADNPFLRYRALLHSYHAALAHGLSDAAYCDLVTELDEAVARVDGRGFRVTPLFRSEELHEGTGTGGAGGGTGGTGEAGGPGGVWVKDETGNVSGSHKGRHLMGVLIHLTAMERAGLTDPAHRPRLAIASCGNAALAAAVVAAAGAWQLTVFIPPDADEAVVARLAGLGAQLVICPREPGVPGDPCYLKLRADLGDGALPFTTQGNENGLAIEGGMTLGYELAEALPGAPGGANGEGALDHLVIQVGGGALASACVQGLAEAARLGALARLPRVHTLQTSGAHPLERAYHRVRALLPEQPRADAVRSAVARAAAHRADYMWPWETEPKSVASGILDDETYDWRAVVEGMLLTGGQPLVVGEDLLLEANALAVTATGIAVDPTGSSGLAGLLALQRDGTVNRADRSAVLFTGIQR
jgi:threonine synthase